jgi:hypothetical protein
MKHIYFFLFIIFLIPTIDINAKWIPCNENNLSSNKLEKFCIRISTSEEKENQFVSRTITNNHDIYSNGTRMLSITPEVITYNFSKNWKYFAILQRNPNSWEYFIYKNNESFQLNVPKNLKFIPSDLLIDDTGNVLVMGYPEWWINIVNEMRPMFLNKISLTINTDIFYWWRNSKELLFMWKNNIPYILNIWTNKKTILSIFGWQITDYNSNCKIKIFTDVIWWCTESKSQLINDFSYIIKKWTKKLLTINNKQIWNWHDDVFAGYRENEWSYVYNDNGIWYTPKGIDMHFPKNTTSVKYHADSKNPIIEAFNQKSTYLYNLKTNVSVKIDYQIQWSSTQLIPSEYKNGKFNIISNNPWKFLDDFFAPTYWNDIH